MFKRRNRAWVAALLAGALVAGVATQASATSVAPDRPTGLTAVLNDGGGGGVLLSWDAPDDTVDSWQVLRKIHPAETAHTVIATVDGELNEWTDTDLTAGDRRYKVVAVRDSLTSRRSRRSRVVLDEPLPPTPGTITYVPKKELATEKAAGDACTPEDSVTVTVGTEEKFLTRSQTWAQFTLDSGTEYRISTNGQQATTILFVCDPTPEEIADTSAASGTAMMGHASALLNFTATATGVHYVKIGGTGTDGRLVRVTDLSNELCSEDTGTACTVSVGNAGLDGTIDSHLDYDWVKVRLVNGRSYQIDLRSDEYPRLFPSFDPSIMDIYDRNGDQITRTGRCDYTNTPPDPPVCTTFFGASYDGFFDYDSGPGNAARVIYTATETGDHFIKVAGRGGWQTRPGDWRLKVTEASAPFFDDFAADASTSGTVSVGGSVSGRIDSTPSWYNAGDTGGPDGYSSREPGYKGDHYGFSCHEDTGDGIELDGDTCDRDWFEVTLTNNRTYKLQLESESDLLLIDGVYRFGSLYQKGGTTYTARSNGIHYISVAGTDGCSGLHGCTGSYTLRVTQE